MIQIEARQSDIIVDYRAREWCRLPYPDHPRGCPNYNHKSGCPPMVAKIESFIDLDKKVLLVVEPFDLAGYINVMRSKHPLWSDRQLRNVLYWQGHVNKVLSTECSLLAKRIGGVWTTCPEAMGVDVIRTVRRFGIPIKPRPTDWVFKIGLVGMRIV